MTVKGCLQLPYVETHVHLRIRISTRGKRANKHQLTNSAASSAFPVKLCTTPPLAPRLRPPSSPNPSSRNIATKSACAAREWRKRGKWCFLASDSCIPGGRSFSVARSGGIRLPGCTHGSSASVSPRVQTAIYHSLYPRYKSNVVG